MLNRKKPLYLTLELNAKMQPMHRHDIEDIIAEALDAAQCGETDGGGSFMNENGEIRFCDIEIKLSENTTENIDVLLKVIGDIKVPKGSFLKGEDIEIPVGILEGLGLYLNGTDLPDETYINSDVNHVVDECKRLLGEAGELYSWWEGSAETALYFYGASFNEMRDRLASFLAEYPLCQKCRVVQIA